MKKTLLAALALAFASSGVWANSLTFQGVTFATTDQGGGVLELTITNALNADPSSNWVGIQYLQSFAIGNVGSFTSANVSIPVAGGPSIPFGTFDAGGLSNGTGGSPNGCNGNGSGWACFFAGSSPLALSNSMKFDIAFKGGTTDFSLPSLKVDFWADPSQTKSTGSLLSQSIPVNATPLPASWTMMLSVLVLGLGVMIYQRAKRANRADLSATA